MATGAKSRRAWVIGIAILAAAAAVRADGPPAGSFAGTYTSAKLTVVLTAGGSGYTGTVQRGRQSFPLTAAPAAGGNLHGTFRSGDDDFPFDATLANGHLMFTSGANTYDLLGSSLGDMMAALGGGGPPTTAPAPTNPPAPTPAAGGSVVGSWAVAGDLGGDKFTLAFGADGGVTVTDGSGNSSSGTQYKYADGKVTFDGSSQVNALSVGGTWTLKWQSADAFTTVADNGKTLTLTRSK